MTHRDDPVVPACPACGGEGHHAPRAARHLAPFECTGPCGVTLYSGTPSEWDRYKAQRELLAEGRD